MPRHANSHATGSSRQLLHITFLPGLPVCGHDCHLYCCVNMLWVCQCCVALMHGYCLMLQGWISGCKSLLVMPVPVATTCDYSFSFAFQKTAWMNREMPSCMMEYCQICMIDIFIHKVCFCNSKVNSDSGSRADWKGLSSQTHNFHSCETFSEGNFTSQANLKTLKLLL